jgi:hypothetical protein
VVPSCWGNGDGPRHCRWGFVAPVVCTSVARDYEECAEQAEGTSVAQRAPLLIDCGARFAGRRKPGGGYSYYDFMQGRSFDIAEPNPTADERKQIDQEYMKYLESAWLDAVQLQDNRPVADLEQPQRLTGRSGRRWF